MPTHTHTHTLECTLSDLLSQFETNPNEYYICGAAAALLAAKHCATTNKKQPRNFPIMADSMHTFQQLKALMPAYMADIADSGALPHWVRRMPSHLRVNRTPFGRMDRGRTYRMKFLRWAIKKFNNPSITFVF